MTRLNALFMLILLVCCSLTYADSIDAYIHTQMQKQHIPGLSLAIVKDDKIVKVKGYGLASLELSTPARPETVYQLASVTKQFVATAVMLLAQDGKIGLEDKIGKYVESAPDAWKNVTLRHLLTHTSGIKDYLNELHTYSREDTTPEKIVQLVTKLPLNFAPGERWSYSNTGYVLLGMVVHKVSGKTYDAFLAERAFKPLGMMSTRRSSLQDLIPNRAAGYVFENGRMRNSDYLNPTLWDNGDGGVLSSALDLAKWSIALDGDTLLNASSREQMWTPVKLGNGGTYAYGYGWGVETVNGHRRISHSGGRPGAACVIARYPDDGIAVILLTNGGGTNPDGLAQGVAKRCLPTLFPPVKTAIVKPALLASCTGYYDAPGGQVLKATVEKGCLSLWAGARLLEEFVPTSEVRFAAEDANRELIVTRTDQGAVTQMTLHLGANKMPLQRIGPLVRTTTRQSDPDPVTTQKLEALLKALAQGGKAMEETQSGLTPGAHKDFPGGLPELAGVPSLAFLASYDVAERQIERHDGKVSRVLYFRTALDNPGHALLVYLTANGLLTDIDLVDD